MQGFALLDGDGAVNAHFLVEVGQHVTDLPVAVGGDGCNVGNGVSAANFGRAGAEDLRDVFYSSVNTFLDVGWIESGLNLLEAFFVDGSSKDSGSGCSISSFVVGLVGDILDQTGTDVDRPIGQLNSLSDSDTILGDFRAAVGLINQNVSSSRTKRNLHGIGQLPASFK